MNKLPTKTASWGRKIIKQTSPIFYTFVCTIFLAVEVYKRQALVFLSTTDFILTPLPRDWMNNRPQGRSLRGESSGKLDFYEQFPSLSKTFPLIVWINKHERFNFD